MTPAGTIAAPMRHGARGRRAGPRGSVRRVESALRPANRLFVALDLPREVRRRLGEAGAAAAAAAPGGRAVPPANLHVTLDFLGRVPPGAWPEVRAAVLEALAGPAIASGLGAARARPRPARARLVAVELLDPEGAIAARSRAVRAAADAVLGRPSDPVPPWPHVTVARFRNAARVDPGEVRIAEHLFDISRAALYDSHQSPAGPPRYRELAAIDLAPVP